MRIVNNFFGRFSEAGDLLSFFWKAKMWFMIPFIVILLAFAVILIFAQTTGVAPFIYALF